MSVAQAMRHRSIRWVGVPLFWLGALGIAAALYARLGADGTWGGMMLYVGATGLSLGTFGLHNDTALSLLLRAQEPLPPAARKELDQELEQDKVATNALSPSPKASYAALGLALLLHSVAAWRLLGALG